MEAGGRLGAASAVIILPELPSDLSRKERSGVKAGDPLDLALIKTDNALDRANARIGRFSGWYGNLKSGFFEGDE